MSLKLEEKNLIRRKESEVPEMIHLTFIEVKFYIDRMKLDQHQSMAQLTDGKKRLSNIELESSNAKTEERNID